jgi:hypothetical protein
MIYDDKNLYLYIDGTFKVIPPQVQAIKGQMYSIHTLLNGVLKTRLITLLPDKKEVCFNAVFNYIIRVGELHNLECKWQYSMGDFEKAIQNAIMTAQPGINVKGCHFHYAQAIYKNLISFTGLAQSFRNPRTGLKFFIK